MSDLPLQGSSLVVAVGACALVWLGLQVLLFRSACDLCSVEPPSWPRALVIVVIVSLLGVLMAGGFALLVGMVGRSSGASKLVPEIAGAVFSLPVQALLAAILYKPLLHVGLFRGLLIWVLQRMLSVLIEAVLLLLAVGGATLVEGFRRIL
jgi:hypothetical protein